MNDETSHDKIIYFLIVFLAFYTGFLAYNYYQVKQQNKEWENRLIRSEEIYHAIGNIPSEALCDSVTLMIYGVLSDSVRN